MKLCEYCGAQLDDYEIKCHICGGENAVVKEKMPKFTIEEKNIFEDNDKLESDFESSNHNDEDQQPSDDETKGYSLETSIKDLREEKDESNYFKNFPTCNFCGNILKSNSGICMFCNTENQSSKSNLNEDVNVESSDRADELYNLAEKYFADEKYEEALKLYKQSFELGNVFAGHCIGSTYQSYLGGDNQVNQQTAFEWYLKAAEQGDEFSQYAIAKYYEDGEIVARNYQKALYWYEKSAEVCEEGSLKLGICYRDGLLGVQKDLQKALDYFILSIKTNYAEIEELNSEKYHECAICYEKIYEQTKDDIFLKKAIGCYEYAVENGYEEDRQEIIRLKSQLENSYNINYQSQPKVNYYNAGKNGVNRNNKPNKKTVNIGVIIIFGLLIYILIYLFMFFV